MCLTCSPILAWISSQFFSGARLRVRGRETFRYVALSQYLQPVHCLDFAASGLASVDVVAALFRTRRGFLSRATALHCVCDRLLGFACNRSATLRLSRTPSTGTTPARLRSMWVFVDCWTGSSPGFSRTRAPGTRFEIHLSIPKISSAQARSDWERAYPWDTLHKRGLTLTKCPGEVAIGPARRNPNSPPSVTAR